jgi:hypothetical protein
MSIFSQTKADITQRIETLLRRLMNKESFSYLEKKIISDAINMAMQDVCLDSGVSRWRFLQENDTIDTVPGTSYVDLDANVFNVISDTVRIVNDQTLLYYTELEDIYSTDPGAQQIGRPQFYALDSSSDPETIRLKLWPTPDAVYTISLVQEKIIELDGISSFPSWMHSLLSDKAKENTLRDFGFFVESEVFKNSYTDRKNNAKISQGHDGAQHIRRVGLPRSNVGFESRIP